MKSDLPCTAQVTHGPHQITAPFTDHDEAAAFVNSQARAANSLGHTLFTARIVRSDGTVLNDITIHSHDVAGAVVAALDTGNGYTHMRVAGIDACIYAHRSSEGDDVLFVGVSADDDQRILLAVNDADLVDTTVGARTGTLRLTGSASPDMTVTCAVHAHSAPEALRILESVACSQPVHLATIPG